MITHLGDARQFQRYAKVAADGTIVAYVDLADGTEASAITADLVNVTDDKTLWMGGKVNNYVPKPPPPPAVDWKTAPTITLTARELADLVTVNGKDGVIALIDAKVKAATAATVEDAPKVALTRKPKPKAKAKK